MANEEFIISVPYIGNPLPRVNWTINDIEVFSSDVIKFETKPTETIFINKKANRKHDSGKYTIFLNNSEGSDSGHCKVTVVGKFYYL